MKYKIAFALIMGSITTALISFTLIAVNIGFGNKFITAWLRSWSISYVLAVAAMLFIAPKIQVLVNYLLKKDLITEKNK